MGCRMTDALKEVISTHGLVLHENLFMKIRSLICIIISLSAYLKFKDPKAQSFVTQHC